MLVASKYYEVFGEKFRCFYSVRRSFNSIENLGDRNIPLSPTSLTCHQHTFVSNIRYQDRSSPRPVVNYEPTIPCNLFLIELIIKIKLCLKIKKKNDGFFSFLFALKVQ